MNKDGKVSHSGFAITEADHKELEELKRIGKFPHKVSVMREGLRLVRKVLELKTDTEMFIILKGDLQGNNKFPSKSD